jgi:toxic protein SymE
MANEHVTRGELAPANKNKQVRFLTVSKFPKLRTEIPWIRIHGLWLKQAGFTIRSKVKVRVMEGCLVITKASDS